MMEKQLHIIDMVSRHYTKILQRAAMLALQALYWL